MQQIKTYFDQWKNGALNKDYKSILILMLPIAITVLVLYVFKIRVWSPVAKRVRTTRNAYRARRQTRRTMRKKR
jgi:uncharacterized membrane protein